jgi:hypothetical protein
MTWTAFITLTLAIVFAILAIASVLLCLASKAVRRLLMSSGFPPLNSRS